MIQLPTWGDKNGRRIQLIDKKYTVGLTPFESECLSRLQAECMACLPPLPPLPDHAELLRQPEGEL